MPLPNAAEHIEVSIGILKYESNIMLLQNPITYLLDNYYTMKYLKKNKKYRSKNINYYIANTYKKTERNKKFKTL